MLLCARTTSGATASWFSWWWPSAKATDGRDSTTCLGFGWPTCSGGMASVLIAMSNSKQCVHGEELVGLHEIRREVATVGQRRAPTAAGALNRPGDESPRYSTKLGERAPGRRHGHRPGGPSAAEGVGERSGAGSLAWYRHPRYRRPRSRAASVTPNEIGPDLLVAPFRGCRSGATTIDAYPFTATSWGWRRRSRPRPSSGRRGLVPRSRHGDQVVAMG